MCSYRLPLCTDLSIWLHKFISNHNVISKHTGRGVVLTKKQFSPTVPFSASDHEFSSDFFTIIKGRHADLQYYFFIEFHCEISLKSGKNPTAPHILSKHQNRVTCVGTLKIEKHMEWSSENLVTVHHISNLSLQFFKIFLKSVTLCLITHPYNPKYSRLQNKNRFLVNANGCLRMHCLRHQLPSPLIYTWILYYHIGHKTWTKY